MKTATREPCVEETICDTDFDPATAQTAIEWLWDCVKAQYPRPVACGDGS